MLELPERFEDVRIIRTFFFQTLCLVLLVRCTRKYLQTSVFCILFSSV
jgi:hypothetical protein